jgi:hypothetical protein
MFRPENDIPTLVFAGPYTRSSPVHTSLGNNNSVASFADVWAPQAYVAHRDGN